MEGKQELEILSELLKKGEDVDEDDEEEEEIRTNGIENRPIPEEEKYVRSIIKGNKEIQKESKSNDPKNIWNEDEILDLEALPDGRDVPKYDISYKQKVSAEDVYLGIDPFKNPSSECFEEIIIKILLPGTNYAHLNLDVSKNRVLCETPKFKLMLPLQYEVKDEKGNAKWDENECTLIISLPISRKE